MGKAPKILDTVAHILCHTSVQESDPGSERFDYCSILERQNKYIDVYITTKGNATRGSACLVQNLFSLVVVIIHCADHSHLSHVAGTYLSSVVILHDCTTNLHMAHEEWLASLET